MISNIIKCVLVGDITVGKTDLLYKYSKDMTNFNEYLPWVFENYCKTLIIDNKSVGLTLWDTSGQEPYNEVRKLSYFKVDIFIILFSLYEKSSFNNAIEKWLPEVNIYNKDSAKIFIGNDFNIEEKEKEVNSKEAEIKIKKLGFELFICEDFSPEGVKLMMEKAIKTVIKNKQIFKLQKVKEKEILKKNNDKNNNFCLLI